MRGIEILILLFRCIEFEIFLTEKNVFSDYHCTELINFVYGYFVHNWLNSRLCYRWTHYRQFLDDFLEILSL